MLDLKDEQLAVQMDSHDSLWGETGEFQINLAFSPLSVHHWFMLKGFRVAFQAHPGSVQ